MVFKVRQELLFIYKLYVKIKGVKGAMYKISYHLVDKSQTAAFLTNYTLAFLLGLWRIMK